MRLEQFVHLWEWRTEGGLDHARAPAHGPACLNCHQHACCERGEVCRYLNGTESCGPMVSRPVACTSDDEERCGAGDQCCGPEELCNAIPEDPTKL